MKKLKWSKILLSILAGTMFCSFFVSVSNANLKAFANFDYSNDEDAITLKPSEVIEKLTGSSVTQLEKDFIDDYSIYELSYQTNKNKDRIVVAAFDNELYVQAQKYTYTDSSNRTLVWIPSSFEYKNITYLFDEDDGSFQAKINTFDGVDTNIKVNYKLDIELDMDLSNDLINKTYFVSKTYSEERDSINLYNLEQTIQYETALEQYNIEHQNYLDEYSQYLIDYQAWEENEEAILTYDSKKAKYDAYQQYLIDLQEYNDYLQAVIDYQNQWNAYNQYVIDKQAYDANKVKYDNYLASKSRIDFCLNAMDIFYQKMPFVIDGENTTRSIYDAVMGGTVTEVLNNKADIVSAGVDATAVDKASVATTGLRNVMTAYKALTTDSEKYSYYHDKYSSDILVHSENLLRSLEYFLRNNIVYSFIKNKGKLYKYVILVAQLMYVCNVLDSFDIKNYEYNKGTSSSVNAAILNESALIDGQTFKQVLGSSATMDTSGDMAFPYYVTIPEEVIPLPEPDEVNKPGNAPEVVEEPTEVEYASDPGIKPQHYSCPTFTKVDPTPPSKPTLKEFDQSKNALADAYNTTLLYREEFLTNPILTFDDSYACDFANQLLHVARFYDNDGELLQEQFFKNSLVYEGELPTKPGDKIFSTYDFDKWVDKNGNVVDLGNLNYSICLYPTFVGGNYNYYDVTWIINNNALGEDEIVVSSRADKLPTPPYEIPIKEDSGDYYYEFIGWDKPFEKVTSTQTYTALFEEKNYYVCYISNIDSSGSKTRVTFKTIEEMEDYIANISPYKDDSTNWYYTFKNWSITCSNTYYYEYKANFTKENFLYVYFVINGETYKQDVKYRKGEMILPYQGETPTKPSKGNETYEFIGWDYDFSNPISANTYITALFETHYHYTIKFLCNDTILSENVYEPGDAVKEPDTSNLSYYKDGIYYVFKGWDKTITEVTSDATYIATFNAVPIVKDSINGNALKISFSDDAITIQCNANNSIDISTLLNLIYLEQIDGNKIIFEFDDCIITVNSTNVGYLARKGITRIVKSFDCDSYNCYTFSITMFDSYGDIYEDDLVALSVLLKGDFNNGRINVSENLNKKAYTLIGGDILCINSIKLNCLYSVTPYFSISVVGGEDAQISISANNASRGQEITFTVDIQEGYRFNGAYLQYNGVTSEVIGNSFIMPNYDVTIVLNVEHIVYSITYMVDGGVYAVVYGYYGEVIPTPIEPTKMSDDNYNYVFTGWDKNDDVFTKDDVYTAIFKANEIVIVKTENKIGKIQIAIICASSVAVVGVGAFLFLRIRKRRNKLKK